MRKNRAYFYVAVSVLCWGTVATLSKVLLESADVFTVAAWTFGFSSLFLFIILAIKKKLGVLFHTRPAVLLKMSGIGSFGVIIYNLLLLAGEDRLPAQQAFVINYLWPSFIILLSALILKEKLTAGKLAAVLTSFAGVFTVTANGSLSFLRSVDPVGALCCVGCALSYALYSVLSKREDYDKDVAVFAAYFSGAVVAFALLPLRGGVTLPTAAQLGGFALYGLICDALPYMTWALAMDAGDTAVVANLAYLTPFVSLILTHLVLKEEITVWSVAGLLLIVAGILLQILFERRSSGDSAQV